MNKILKVLLGVLFFFNVSCLHGQNIITGFKPLNNLKKKELQIDLSNVIGEGIFIPTQSQVSEGLFEFEFNLENTTNINQTYYYKLFYQNESYKFIEVNKDKSYNKFAAENFYGSWENTDIGFKPTSIIAPGKKITVKDTFRIVGNPRNEKKYFGAHPDKFRLNSDSLHKKTEDIRHNETWYNAIVKKALENNVSIDEQLYKDALWSLNEERHNGNYNNRWKRNPRVGKYSFLLIVVSEKQLKEIPDHVKNIAQTNSDGHFVNPYYFFKYGPDLNKQGIEVITSTDTLIIKARLDLNSGIYINPFEVKKYDTDKANFNSGCGDSQLLNRQAHFEQYYHNIDKNLVLENIPLSEDVTSDLYDQKAFFENAKKYENKMVKDVIHVSESPCKTVSVPEGMNKILIKNPAASNEHLHKENVGVKTRIGFTYGKHTLKVKFPEMLNSDNVWNGLTYAIWLIFQDESSWNNRRPSNTGYIWKGDDRKMNAERLKELYYSEIDFEIVKTTENWPSTSYINGTIKPKQENAITSGDIMVSCTNWDMACRDHKNYIVGAQPFNYEDKTYILHRWDHWYKALTARIPEKDDELFKNDYYYFQIDWQPDKIIWKIGPEKNKLKTICVMDHTVTEIPNNQMVLVVTQEYHDSKWWPIMPFKQEYVPFPSKDIIGEILDVEIE